MTETIKDLLTDKEKIEYYELVLRLHREEDTLSKEEHTRIFREANKVLLKAVNREIEKRKLLKGKIE